MAWRASIHDISTKLRPGDTPANQTDVTIHLARGQWAAFQVGLFSDGEDVSGVDVEFVPPAQFSNAVTYRAIPYNVISKARAVVNPAHDRGDSLPGEFFDALVPKRDPFYDEPRLAFPFNVNRISAVYDVFDFRAYDNLNEQKILRANLYSRPHPVITGTFSGGSEANYLVKVEVSATTFQWSDDGGQNYTTGVPMNAGTPVPLSNGLSITWQVGAGYAANEEWEWFARPTRCECAWVEAYVPADLTAGTYSGIVRVSASGKGTLELNFSVVVYDHTTVPKQPTLRSHVWGASFVTKYQLIYGHYLQPWVFDLALEAMYQACGLRNRLTIIGLGQQMTYDQNAGSITPASRSAYKEWLRPFVEGTHPAWPGATITEYEILRPEGIPGTSIAGKLNNNVPPPNGPDYLPAEKIYMQTCWEVATELGCQDKLTVCSVEEPSFTGGVDDPPPVYMTEAIMTMYASFKAVCPGGKFLANKRIVNTWEPYIDYFSVVTFNMADYPRPMYNGKPLVVYNSFHQVSRYWSATDGYIYPVQMPSELISTPAHMLRVLYWFDWDSGADGESYCGCIGNYALFSPLQPSAIRTDCWDCNVYYRLGGDGEWTWFYPGKPNLPCGPYFPTNAGIGGTHHIPIESVRLKIIRRGYEDWEIFKAAVARGFEPEVRSMVRGLIGSKVWYLPSPPLDPVAMDLVMTNILALVEGVETVTTTTSTSTTSTTSSTTSTTSTTTAAPTTVGSSTTASTSRTTTTATTTTRTTSSHTTPPPGAPPVKRFPGIRR